MSQQSEPAADRVLVLTPFGRDAEMVCERLRHAGIVCEVCGNIDALVDSMEACAGAALIAHEALADGGANALLAALDAQQPWSDLPVIVLAQAPRGTRSHTHVVFATFEGANVTVLERPISVQLLLSTLRAAIRARERQYETRDLLNDLQRAIELGDMFVSILGHDLRTPLSSIRMSAEAIVRGSDEIHSLRPAGRILRGADRMTRMIEQLLDFARARQPHGMVVDPVPADLHAIALPAVNEIQVSYPSGVIELVMNGDLLGTWDADLLDRMISNLVGNAVKHGTADTPVTVELDGTSPSTVTITVTNAGAIPGDAIPTIFEPFKQANRAVSGERGLGLGLFIAEQIALAHRGTIALTPTEADVTSFEVQLPRHATTGHEADTEQRGQLNTQDDD